MTVYEEVSCYIVYSHEDDVVTVPTGSLCLGRYIIVRLPIDQENALAWQTGEVEKAWHRFERCVPRSLHGRAEDLGHRTYPA